MNYEIEQYKRENHFDTSKGIDRGIGFSYDGRRPEDLLLYELEMIGVDEDGEIDIKAPYITAHQIDASPLLRYYGDSAEDEEQKEMVRNQLIAEYISTINKFYEMPIDDAHTEAIKDNQRIDVAHSLMELAFRYSLKDADGPAFSGKISPNDFDEAGNFAKPFPNEEAELAYMLALEEICRTGKTDAEIKSQTEMREFFNITPHNAPNAELDDDEYETLGERQERQQELEMYGARHEIGNELIPELPIIQKVGPRTTLGGKAQIRVPLMEIGYAFSNGEFENKLQWLAKNYISTCDESPLPESLPSNTGLSENNYWLNPEL